MKPTPIDLQGAVVAVTGAGRGIGLATARAFAERGARVALGDLDTEAAQGAARLVGHGAEAFALDVTERASFAEFVDATRRTLGELDVLVNNAGIMPAGPFLEENDATATAQFDVNVHGPIYGMKLVLPGMLERARGHVVNVASYAGKAELPGLATYCASKHAVVGLTGTVNRELEGTGVTLTCVMPSAVDTELSSGIPMPLERFAKVRPEQVADAIVASIKGRPREVTVPSWVASYEPLTAFVPHGVERRFRKLIGDERAITQVDAAGRAAYTERLARDNNAVDVPQARR